MKHSALEMLVVLDSHPSSHAPLAIAQSYAAGTVLLTSWSADATGIEAVVQESASADPTISDALQAAAQRGLAWVGIRRDFAPPEQILRELLVGTARHADDDVPGFSVFLVDGEPVPFCNILAIVDRSGGPISGLLAYAAVAVADTAGAALDILVIGDADENPRSEDEYETLVISREQELFDAAVQRARTQRLSVRWITAASVADPWAIVSDQLSQQPYDLVIDDLGDVSLGRIRMRDTLEGALVDGAVGEVPLKLLTQTSLPLLLVLDEIRLGLAPPTLLRTGVMAAFALGMIAAPAAAAASEAPPPVMATAEQADPVDELITDLETALLSAQAEASPEAPAGPLEQAREAAIAQAGLTQPAAPDHPALVSGEGADGADPDQAVALTTAPSEGPYPAAAVVPIPAMSAESSSDPPAAPAPGTGSVAASGAPAAWPEVEPEAARAAEPAEPKPPKAPKGGASPSDLEKAKDQEAAAKKDYQKDKSQRADAQDALAEAEGELAEAQHTASVAVTDLDAARMAHADAAEFARTTESEASGVSGLLPGAPSEDDVASAQLAEQAATQRLDQAISTGEESLAALQAAEQALVEEQAALDERSADVQETKAEYEQAAEKTDVYQESLADTRQSPVAKGDYDLTAPYGATGGLWSSGMHTGMDFAGSAGTEVMAAASGTVVSTGYAGPYGNQVVVDHGDGYQTTYSHLSSIDVEVGEEVQTGDRVGAMGSTGNTTGTHLHFEVTQDGKFVDPAYWLGW